MLNFDQLGLPTAPLIQGSSSNRTARFWLTRKVLLIAVGSSLILILIAIAIGVFFLYIPSRSKHSLSPLLPSKLIDKNTILPKLSTSSIFNTTLFFTTTTKPETTGNLKAKSF